MTEPSLEISPKLLNKPQGSYIIFLTGKLNKENRLDQLLDGINLAVNIQVSEAAASNISGKYLECQNCGHLYNTALEATYPSHPGSVDTVRISENNKKI